MIFLAGKWDQLYDDDSSCISSSDSDTTNETMMAKHTSVFHAARDPVAKEDEKQRSVRAAEDEAVTVILRWMFRINW